MTQQQDEMGTQDAVSTSVHETIVTTMGKRIVSGHYLPGAVIGSETDIGQTFSASRTATREALKILSSKGLIEGRPKVGVVVRSTERWNMMDPLVLDWALQDVNQAEKAISDLYVLRMAIEPKAARMAAHHHGQDDEAAVRRALRGMATYLDENDRVEQDVAFHIAILRASGNRLFFSLGELISVGLRHLFHAGLRATSEEDDRWITRHKRVADAMFARDETLAETEMVALLAEARQTHNVSHQP
ncbi:MAG: FadR/GntR family transcriptional regulator [Shinella zoogloeoides]|uniref:FadR/GntR family transcriptional regulator n=1 Tax=Shinella zoogloeoides TaxID=352475 RepID=UPI003C71A755